MEESWQAVRLQAAGKGREQQRRQQHQRQQQGLLKERTIPEGRENVVAVHGRVEASSQKETPRRGAEEGAGERRERRRERRAVYGAWLSVAIINHILVSRLAPRRQGYHSKGIR